MMMMMMIMVIMRREEEQALPNSPLPVRPFLIRYMAQDRGPELENAPGFIPQSWVQTQRLGPKSPTPSGECKDEIKVRNKKKEEEEAE